MLGEKERLLYSGSQKSGKMSISKVLDQADEFSKGGRGAGNSRELKEKSVFL